MVEADERRFSGLWPKRIGWLLLIWSLGVVALGAIAIGLKFVMRLAGLTL